MERLLLAGLSVLAIATSAATPALSSNQGVDAGRDGINRLDQMVEQIRAVKLN
jgi:hypothetical protein